MSARTTDPPRRSSEVENYVAGCEAKHLFDDFLAYAMDVQAERAAAE